MTTLLGRAGVRDVAAREALRVLIVYTIGFAAFATRPPLEDGADRLLTNRGAARQLHHRAPLAPRGDRDGGRGGEMTLIGAWRRRTSAH